MSEMQSAFSQFEGHLLYTKTEGFLIEFVFNLLQSFSLTLYKVRPCKVIQDSLGFWIPDSSWIPVSSSVELGFRISDFGFRISDSLLVKIGFRIPKPRILDSTSKILPDSEI